MGVEKIKHVVKLTDLNVVNAYLDLGWVISASVIVSTPVGKDYVDQSVVYHMAWVSDGEPKYPADPNDGIALPF